ncbi:MAG: hypothetical protein JJ900_17520 [Rhodospirillales bacterium]|nr:hypothetical protein [Rhodospirillales bacterium]
MTKGDTAHAPAMRGVIRALGVAGLCTSILSACVNDAGVDGSEIKLAQADPQYTVQQARDDISSLESHINSAKSTKISGPFVIEGMRGLVDGDYERANHGFQRALKFDPRNSYLHMLNALAHQLRGEAGDPEQFALAQVGYELAAKMDPGSSQVPYFMGLMKFRQQRFYEAREQFARAVLLDPEQPGYLTGLAAASYYLGELDVAYAVVRKATELAPRDPEVLRTSGIIFAAVGDFDDAEKSKNALDGVSNTRKKYVAGRIDDWARYYANNRLMNDPEVVDLLAQNLDAFGIPQGGMFDSESGSNEDPVTSGSSGTTDTTSGDTSSSDLPPPSSLTTDDGTASSTAAGSSASGSTTTTTTSGSATDTTTTSDDTTSTTSSSAATDSSDAPRAATTQSVTKAPIAPAQQTPPAAPAKPKIKLPKMALVDVAIIRTEEIYRSSKGVNLLNGLNIFFTGDQFLQFKTPLGLGRIRSASTTNDVVTLKFGTAGAGLTYSLNIFNDNYDRNEVIARPTILVEDQKKSSFFSGGTLHIVIEGGVAGSGAIQPINTGVNLEVTPQFLDEETVDLNVFAQRTFLESSLSQVSDTITGTSFATTSKTTITANLTLRYGETMVLSGLSDQEKENLDDKTPGLGDIPGIQYLFRNQVQTESKKTVLILLTPRRASLDYDAEADATAAPEKAEDTNIGKLEKNASWMKPAPHLKALVRHLSKYDYFNHFRTGDMQLETWAGEGTVLDAIKRSLSYLYIYYDFEKNEKPQL